MDALPHIKAESTTHRVLTVLREAILSRKLLPGQRIAQRDLAAQLGVSITPVREALFSLQNEQLIRIEPHKETIILGVTEKYIRDYFETRDVLECHLVRQVCRPGTDTAAIEEAFARLEEIVAAGRFEEFEAANIAFHKSIYQVAGNQCILNLLAQIGILKSLSAIRDLPSYAKTSQEEHRAVMKYIRLHEPEAAAEQMHAQLVRSMNSVLAAIGPEEAAVRTLA